MSGFDHPHGPPGPGHGPPGPGARGTRSNIDGRLVGGPDLGNDLAGRSRSLPGGALGRAPGVNDPLGIGQLGRADLDPFAPIGPGTGMLADPRGMRQPQPGVPPGVPPGARFDPYGPTAPRAPNFGGGGGVGPFQGQGSEQPPFGGPTPDHLPMPPFRGTDPPIPGQPTPRGRDPPPFGGPSPDEEQPPPGCDDMFM